MDGAGEIFKLLDADDALDYPVISGIDRQFIIDQADQAREMLIDAVALLAKLEERKVFNVSDISELYVDADDGFTVYTRIGGVPVKMGWDNFENKLDRLERIYDDLEPRLLALRYIDLNVAERVIVQVDVKRSYGKG